MENEKAPGLMTNLLCMLYEFMGTAILVGTIVVVA